ncbi:hypothetical protein [Leptolyngbya phage Lbo-JY16]
MNREEYDGFSPLHKSWAFGVVQYARIGAMECLTIFGMHIYMRAGKVKWLLGFSWG